MMITEETARKQLETLHQEGSALLKAFMAEEEGDSFEEGYQRWYSRALPLMKRLAPDRYSEFQRFYSRSGRFEVHYSRRLAIQDYFLGVEDDFADVREEAGRCFTSQLALLKSVSERLAWGRMDTDEQTERGLQLALLETARDLIKVNERSAGALAGTVLEVWLDKLCAKHTLKFRKQRPPLREYIGALHTSKVFDIPVHAQAVWLAEIATRSTAEGESPTKLQVRDLIDSSRWLITNVF
ncbi:MAG TPA: hypothetical protein VLV87_11055 [Gammaproteobacteria bacterium]|nr:hypothetical protein [Gammaproteobacteria bacterium]